MKRRTFNGAGLNQLGPRHWLSEDENRHLKELSRPIAWTLNRKARASTRKRKVKVTLPDRA